mgnify:CR=1 FL=1
MRKALTIILLLVLSACQSSPNRVSSDRRDELMRVERMSEFMRSPPFYETWRHRGKNGKP